MTVLNEHKNLAKYTYLTFIEFLEMFCRVTIVGISMLATVDHKAHTLLEILYRKHRFEGRLDPIIAPQQKVRT